MGDGEFHPFTPYLKKPEVCSVCGGHKTFAHHINEAGKLVEIKPSERAKDEHEGFAKLKGELSHEKGVTDPAALAASIGRKKYGAAGMAKKAAAGRAKDAGKLELINA